MKGAAQVVISQSGIKDPWLDYIWRRAHMYNKSFICIVVGDSGDGKSWSVMKMAEIIDPKFTIDNVVFSAKEYMAALDRITRKGTVIIWDEVGIGANARKWDSLINIAVTEVIETQRFLVPIVFLTTPDPRMSDTNIRSMVNSFCEARRFGSRPAELYVYIVNRDRKRNKTYFVHPRVKIRKRFPDGRTEKFRYRYDKMIFRSLPSEKLREAYEIKQVKFKNELRRRNMKTLLLAEKYEDTSTERVKVALTDVLSAPEEYMNIKKRLDWHIIKDVAGLSRDDAQTVKRIAEKELEGKKKS